MQNLKLHGIADPNLQDMVAYEHMCAMLYGQPSPHNLPGMVSEPLMIVKTQQEASSKLEAFNADTNNIGKLKYFLENSQSTGCQYLSASAMKTMLGDHWRTITPEQKMAIRKYCVDYLRSESLVLSRANYVVRMMILLLAKIVKLGWFDDPEVRNAIVPDLTAIVEQGND